MTNPRSFLRPTSTRRHAAATTVLVALGLALLAAIAPHRAGAAAHVPPRFSAERAYFSDARHGWVLGDATCPQSGRAHCPALIRTVDGGRHWTRLGVPRGLVSTHDRSSCDTNGTIHGPCVNHVMFADAEHGYLWSLLRLYWTDDGGRTWHGEPTGGIWPASGATVLTPFGDHVLRVRPLFRCSSGCEGRVQIAKVGTDAWHTITPARTGLFSTRVQTFGNAVYVFAGTWASDGPGHPGRGLFRSTDLGRHWQHVLGQPCGVERSGSDVVSLTEDFTIAPDGTRTFACLGQRFSVRIAAPGHSAYSTRRALPRLGEYLGTASATRVDAVVNVRDDSGTSATMRVATSGDAGRTWTIGRRVTTDGDLPRLVGAHFGYAVTASRHALLITRSGGQHWRTLGL